MKKVLNWTIGSFFRTIGRTIAFLVMGGLIYYILTYNGFGIEDLFFEKVNASTYQNSDWYTYYDSQNNVLPSYFEYQYMTNNVTTTNGDYTGSLFVLYNQTKDLTPLKGGKIVIPFFIETPTIYNTTHSTVYGSDMCTRYQCTQWDSYNNCLRYTCDYTTASQDSTIDNKVLLPAQVEIYAILVYTNGYAESCSFSRDTMSISCNVSNNTLVGVVQDIRVFHKVYYNNSTISSTYKFGLGSRVQYFSDSTTTIIDNQQQQMQQEQQQHEEIMDSNTTQAEEEATSFFEDFDVPDVGGLSSIITAPLNTIRSLLNSTCTSLTLPLPFVNNKNLTLPCMSDIYSEHFGAFFTLYQTIILALIAYRCVRSIFFDIHGFTNPNDDRIEVMDL